MSSQSSGSEPEKNHEQFIEVVKKHEVLYKTDHENYRDKNFRQKAWEQVVAECGMVSSKCAQKSVEDAKNRWKYLRDTFTDSHKKQIRQNWRYRKQMEFLLPYVGLRRRKVDKMNKGNDVVDLTADEPDLIRHNYSQFVEATLEEEHPSAVNGNIVINEKQPNSFELYTKMPIVSQENEHQKAVNEKTVKKSKSSKDYELYKFFMVMYKEVLQFPDRKKVDVKKRIFNVVTEEELNTTKINAFRKRSLGVTSNNLPVRKSKFEENDNSSSSLPKRSSLTRNNARISKQLPMHSKNKESHISSNCILSKGNSLDTNYDLNSLPKCNTSLINSTKEFSNQWLLDQSNHEGNELNSLPKPSTSSINTHVVSNQVNEESKNKEPELNVLPFSPIVSLTTRENTKTITFPNQVHKDILQRIGSQISIKFPKRLTASNDTIFSNGPQTDQSLPKITSAITISPNAFSKEQKIDHSKNQKSELHPIPIASSSPIFNNLNAGTTLVISNVEHIQEKEENILGNNPKSPQAGCSISKNGDAFVNKLQSTEIAQNKKEDLHLTTEASSSPTLNSTSVPSEDKIIVEQNVEKELSPVHADNVVQKRVLSTDSVDTIEKIDINNANKKDKDLLRLSKASYLYVEEIMLSDENE